MHHAYTMSCMHTSLKLSIHKVEQIIYPMHKHVLIFQGLEISNYKQTHTDTDTQRTHFGLKNFFPLVFFVYLCHAVLSYYCINAKKTLNDCQYRRSFQETQTTQKYINFPCIVFIIIIRTIKYVS